MNRCMRDPHVSAGWQPAGGRGAPHQYDWWGCLLDCGALPYFKFILIQVLIWSNVNSPFAAFITKANFWSCPKSMSILLSFRTSLISTYAVLLLPSTNG